MSLCPHSVFPSPSTGEVFLHHPRHLPQPQHHEGHRGERWGEGAGQTALLPQDHGAQTKQGSCYHVTQEVLANKKPGCVLLIVMTFLSLRYMQCYGLCMCKPMGCCCAPQNLPEIILISCINDLHLCREYFLKNIGERNMLM